MSYTKKPCEICGRRISIHPLHRENHMQTHQQKKKDQIIMSDTTILPDGSAFSTATIMSKEEAMKLPPKDRPICFRISSEMYHGVWESIGAASMTFNESAGNKVFNTEQASKIATDLCFKIASEVESKTEKYRDALFTLVGVTDVKELDAMKKVLEIMPDCDEKRAATKAVAVLLETP